MGSPFRHLTPHFKEHWPSFALGIVALLTTNLLHAYLPRLLKHAVDGLQGGAALTAVAGWAFLRLLLVLAQGGLRYGWRMGFFGLGRKVEYGMRGAFFGKLLQLPPAYYVRTRLGDLVSRALSDLATVRESLGFGWLALFDSLSMVALALVFMLRVDAGLVGLVLLPMALLPPLIMTLGRKVRDGSQQAQKELDGLSQAATESFAGARVVHAYARQEAEAARFEARSRHYRDRSMALVKLEAWYWPLLTVVSGCSELLLFYLGAQRMAEGRMSVGDFVMLQDYLISITWPVMALGFTTNMYQRGKVSVERLNEVYDEPTGMEESTLAPLPPGAGGAQRLPAAGRVGGALGGAPLLEFHNVHLTYATGPEILRGVDLSLRPGEWLGLAGRTGAGKTSLLRLPLRLYDPSAGRVLFEGLDVRAWPLPALRGRMGAVMQEPYLFSETVLENAAFGLEGEARAHFAEAVRWAKAADFHETAVALPLGYDSMLGEKGVNLSGGQKQRLALARALALRPALLLLDDPFSAVDTATEERIVAGLRAELKDTAVLLVSHRASTLRLCDRVAVLEEGRVAEEGPPQELGQREGRFFEMLRREQLAKKAGLEGRP